MLLFEWQEGYLACKSSATTIPKSLLLETNLTQSNFGKKGQLDNNGEYLWVRVCACDGVCMCIVTVFWKIQRNKLSVALSYYY